MNKAQRITIIIALLILFFDVMLFTPVYNPEDILNAERMPFFTIRGEAHTFFRVNFEAIVIDALSVLLLSGFFVLLFGFKKNRKEGES